jgi:3-dehydroquinate dehydratase-1
LPRDIRPDAIEARIDLFADHSPQHVETVLRRLRGTGVPLIGTIRTAAEGGRWRAGEADRERLFAAILPLVEAVDVELTARALARRVARLAHAAGRTVIVSSHDFRRTPSAASLTGRVRAARALGADIVKLAVATEGPSDLARILGILVAHRRVPMVAVAIGRAGTLSRVFFPAAGSLLTYAFARGDAPSAPGQLALDDLQRDLARYYPGYRTRAPSRR